MGGLNFINLDYIFLWIYLWFRSFSIIAFLQAIVDLLAPLRPYGWILMIILFILCAYCIYELYRLEKVAHDKLYGLPKPESVPVAHVHKQVNQKWLKVEALVNSQNPSDWRQAILESDIMLADVLTQLGYHGDSIGEQLKSVDPVEMLTHNDAWEAHKVRNMIAHEGSDFPLNEREAKRVVDLYKKVFKEFDYI